MSPGTNGVSFAIFLIRPLIQRNYFIAPIQEVPFRNLLG